MPVPDHAIQGTFACWATMVDEILSPRDRIADPGGPIKTIFDFARVSGSRGFSEAWPLQMVNIYLRGLTKWLTNPPRQHAHRLVPQHPQWNQHWHSCCCCFHRGPQRIGLPYGYTPRWFVSLPEWPWQWIQFGAQSQTFRKTIFLWTWFPWQRQYHCWRSKPRIWLETADTPITGVETNLSDNSVTLVSLDEVGYPARRCRLNRVSACKRRRQLLPLSVNSVVTIKRSKNQRFLKIKRRNQIRTVQGQHVRQKTPDPHGNRQCLIGPPNNFDRSPNARQCCLFEGPLNSCRLNLPINWATLEWSYMSEGPFAALPLGVAEDMVDEIRLLDLIWEDEDGV